MINQRWMKRILRAQPQNDVVASSDVIVAVKIGEKMKDCVEDNEKLMNYLQKDNYSGHATNCDMLVASVNPIQHMREAILTAKCEEDAENNCYLINFPFGVKEIELKLSKIAVDKANE